ncbi:biofilm development regulator YmgB/AriR family protein [Cronobacter universalis]|uniref:Two-component-system connector protein AriR n=1 Tax=Cronobacter universalis NCTC 9529 TaxID=1074000 RepID=A0AAC8VU20_9ENTR|nr:biofilm development regulator YmgB/AriR family protein [Cronobacter universalis]ALB57041.1 two-component-system connector protein AriR [Cronobacter universalis NCTC 9529]ELY3468697.1 two-component-system connector protein AriR [Cronobacter universalis]ELY3761588.1 two-component-system connector protein AriR [Cronobacter universalis]ELY6247260.1 two-component-system connector protein AriR [Cronobacter universalis]ELY7393622.1 two-component-system connector protein AriR [Cronobacter universal
MSPITSETAISVALPDAALADYFHRAGDKLAQEAALLGQIVQSMVSDGAALTHKTIIQQLLDELETTKDVAMGDVIRRTLGIVVDHTLDDR